MDRSTIVLKFEILFQILLLIAFMISNISTVLFILIYRHLYLYYLYFMSLISTHLCPLFYLLNLLFPWLYNISLIVILFAIFLHCITWLVLTIKFWPPSYYIAPGPFQSSLEWAECWALKTLFKATPWDHKYQAPRWLLTSVVGFSILSLSYRYLASML